MRPKIVVIGSGICLVLAIAAITAGFILMRHPQWALWARVELFDETKQPWEACAISHPGGTPPLVFMQRSMHAFLAEYRYKVRFGNGTNTVECWLPLNVGGATRMNAYWYPRAEGRGPYIRLRDHWGDDLLDMAEHKTHLIVRYKGRLFAGEISESSPDGGYGTVDRTPVPDLFDDQGIVTETNRTASSDTNEPVYSVSVGTNDAVDITASPFAIGPGQYFGRIEEQNGTLRFVPTSQSPEVVIEMVE